MVSLQAGGTLTLGQLLEQRFEHLDQGSQMVLVVSPGIDGTRVYRPPHLLRACRVH